MALLDNFFSKVMPAKASAQETGRAHSDTSPPSLPSIGGHAADRKSLRLERRELLYGVVRESMARVGMLSSSYKYKVLSLDPRGRQYLIMMDIPQDLAADAGRLAEIESGVAQNAKARHDIVVTAVYWRINEPVTSGLLRKPRTSSAADGFQVPQAIQAPAVQAAKLDRQTPPGRQASRFEPIRDDEVAAFRQALAAGVTSESQVATGKVIKSWRRNPALQADFADTQLQEPAGKSARPARRQDFQDTEPVDSVEKVSPLSSTQYGDLN